MAKVNSNTQNPQVKEDNSLSDMQLKRARKKQNIWLSRVKRRLLKHVWILRALILSGFIFFLYFILSFGIKQIAKTSFGAYVGLAKDFITAPNNKFKSFDGRTNILILGKGGAGHDAPDLTDTIILASISNEDPEIDLISLPRDIWLIDLRAKLNSIYYWGNQREPDGGGLVLAKSVVEEITGIPVHYALVIDFSGFENIIDAVDGIDVEIDNSFVDEKYPITGKENDTCDGDPEFKCRYETVSFEKGLTHMDGEIALKFVRSRNAEGDEGTDLARAARQQKVLSAIKNKVSSREIIFSPKKLLNLKDSVLSAIETDITSSEGAVLARKVFNARENLTQHVLPEDFLENPPKMARYDNLYVFIPKNDDPSLESDKDWSKVHDWVSCILENGECI